MNRLFLMTIVLFLFQQDICAIDRDSNTYKYLVLRSKIIGVNSRIVQDHSYIELVDTSKLKYKGFLEILSDTTFRIWSKRGDTVAKVHLNAIRSIRAPTGVENFTGWFLILVCTPMTIASSALLIDGIVYDDLLFKVLGTILTSEGILGVTEGFFIKKGKRFNKFDHRFIIHYAKGYKLKKKHLKKLYPIKKI